MSTPRPNDGRDGHDAAAASAERPPERIVDPRAVRIGIAPTMPHLDLDPLVAEPPPMPVAPIPSVVGRGILGGTADIAALDEASTAAGGSEADGATGPAAPALTQILVDGTAVRAAYAPLGDGRGRLTVEGADGGLTEIRLLVEPLEAPVDGRGAARREVVVDGWRIELDVESERRAALRDRARRGREESAHGGPTEVHAIIPGRIVSVSVAAGDAVVASQQLLVVEAMKMQNELRAPRDGTITKVAVAPGETIEIGDLLLVLE